jgi:hypothetical protein
MTVEEAIEVLKNDIEICTIQQKQACDMAIKALEQQPCEDVLEKIKTEISRYELDCRFADYSQTDECTICNKNVFGSIYKIIDKYKVESEE